MKKLNEIQQKLKVPKGQYNSFGKYSFRNCEDILEAVKPLLGESILTIDDEIVIIGDRIYVKATATITDGKDKISATAYAREAKEQKGMNEAQITGSTSSYARKYALNGLLLIDDTKDDDTRNTGSTVIKSTSQSPKDGALIAIKKSTSVADLSKVVEKIKHSTILSESEKSNLMAEVDFRASELTN